MTESRPGPAGSGPREKNSLTPKSESGGTEILCREPDFSGPVPGCDPELVPTKRSMAQIRPEGFKLFY